MILVEDRTVALCSSFEILTMMALDVTIIIIMAFLMSKSFQNLKTVLLVPRQM